LKGYLLVSTVKLTVVIDLTVLQALMRKKIVIFSFLLGIVLVAFVPVYFQFFAPIVQNAPPMRMPMPSPNDSSTPPTSLGVVEEIVSNLEWGNIAFDTPKKIKFEEPKTIELLLSPTKSFQELQSSLKSHEQTESARIQISNRMEADLSGLGFKIEALVPQEQAVYRGKTTQWKWEVTPTKDGNQNLYLTLSAIINVSNQKVPLVVRTFDKTIKVEVSVSQRISTFVSSNWQWLWASILVPLSPLLWKWYQKKRGKKPSPNNPGAGD
jgi:hypothetical protein